MIKMHSWSITFYLVLEKFNVLFTVKIKKIKPYGFIELLFNLVKKTDLHYLRTKKYFLWISQ